MVYLVEILSHKKQYGEETVYLAVNIADRYMSIMAERGEKPPCHVLIALTSTILAAKMTESVIPCFDYTASLLPEVLREKVQRADWKSLEN